MASLLTALVCCLLLAQLSLCSPLPGQSNPEHSRDSGILPGDATLHKKEIPEEESGTGKAVASKGKGRCGGRFLGGFGGFGGGFFPGFGGGFGNPGFGGFVNPNFGGFVNPNLGGFVNPNLGGFNAGFNPALAGGARIPARGGRPFLG